MKNVLETNKKKCIFKLLDDFTRDVKTFSNGTIEVVCDYEGLYCERDGEDIDYYEIVGLLSNYYDVEVTSFHIDDEDMIGVWICYK